MKGLKVLLVIMAAAMVTLGLSGISYAFHDGGVATCDSCHTMHNANGAGVAMAKNGKAAFTGNVYLLQGSDQSSTCLNCHAVAEAIGGSYHIMSPDAGTTGLPTHFTPGGDFGWLLATPATPPTSYDKTRRGHNINAADYGLGASTLTTAPGGTYAQSNLHCSSCHDPHGTYRHTAGDPTAATDIASSVFTSGGASKPTSASGSYGVKDTAGNAVGVYRLLAGKGYLPASYSGGPAFLNDSPIAIAPKTYDVVATTFNVTGGTSTGSEVLVQYGQNMSEWCQNCHAATGGGMTNNIHPASSTESSAKLSNQTVGTGSIAANYTSYIGSGNMTGTNQYSALVPVEVGTLTALTGSAPNNGTAPNVTGNSNVMCLSCHRAHASAWQNMTRYDVNNELMTVAGAYNLTARSASGYSLAQYTNAMDGRPATVFASNQRILCNKCHAKD